ncbi:MAG: SCP2 sterol-binding domain-containing protein, partial [Methylococcaceae bacterium]|nr:SCP2 sterol-binding domain-containing protein [Methylococcaceae bacterium]
MSAIHHPLLAASLTESLRTLIRQHLSETPPEGRSLMERLSGQVIALRLEPFGKLIYLCPTAEDIQILTEISGEPDVTIACNLAAFARASFGGTQESLKASDLEVIGNAETAQQFQALSQALKIDWQRFLSRYLGYRLTGSILALARAGREWTRDSLDAAQADIAVFLREETRWLPDSSETDAFHAEVD